MHQRIVRAVPFTGRECGEYKRLCKKRDEVTETLANVDRKISDLLWKIYKAVEIPGTESFKEYSLAQTPEGSLQLIIESEERNG